VALAVAPLIATVPRAIANAAIVARNFILSTLYKRLAAPWQQQRSPYRPAEPAGRFVTTIRTAVSLPVR
jgi:hypothetical protein